MSYCYLKTTAIVAGFNLEFQCPVKNILSKMSATMVGLRRKF